MQSARREEYWSRNLRITAILLGLWFFVTYVIGFFARDLTFSFFGWPFSFYMAAQGTTLIYLLIIGGYAYAVNRMEREAGAVKGAEDGHEAD